MSGIETDFIPSDLSYVYNFFIDETDSDLNPMINFIGKYNDCSRYYEPKKTKFEIKNNIIHGGDLLYDPDKNILRFIKYHPEYDHCKNIGVNTFNAKNFINIKNNPWQKYFNVPWRVYRLSFDIPYHVEKNNNHNYFYIRGEILNTLLDLNKNIGIENTYISPEETHYKLIQINEIDEIDEKMIFQHGENYLVYI